MFHKELSAMISSVVEKKPSISALSCVLVGAEAKTITGTDMDIVGIIHNTPITGKGFILVDAYALRNIAQSTKKSFSMILEGDKLRVESDGDIYTLESQEKHEKFPSIVEGAVTSSIKDMPVSLFKVSVCSSTDQSRYYLNGVFLHAKEQTVHAVATDGHRLAKRSAGVTVSGDGFNEEMHVIVPTKTVKAIQKLFSDKINPSLTDKRRLSITQGNIHLISGLIDGNFPDYERVIPQEENASVMLEMDGKEVARLCGKANVVDGHEGHLFGGPGGYWLRVSGKKSKVEKHLHKEAVNNFSIGFNVDYMADLIDNMENKVFTLRVIDASSPMRINDGDNLYVLMPMYIS